MNTNRIFVAYYTIVRKEVVRFSRVWIQTLMPSVITAVLYYVIFGTFIGSQISSIHGFSYLQFIAPGLVMMAVITNAYTNTVSSFYFAKFQRNIEEIMVAPVPYPVVIAGFVTGGVLRALAVGVLVLVVAMFFTSITIHSIAMIALFFLLTAVLFSIAGLINAVFASSFDSISIFPTFVLTPLTYLGGIFYSTANLPLFWQHVSFANPIFYMINGFRYGFLGITDVSLVVSLTVIIVFIVVLTGVTFYLFEKGYGLRP